MEYKHKYFLSNDLADMFFYPSLWLFILLSFMDINDIWFTYILVILVPGYIVFKPLIKKETDGKLVYVLLRFAIYCVIQFFVLLIVIVIGGFIFTNFNLRTLIKGENSLLVYFILFCVIGLYILIRILGGRSRNYIYYDSNGNVVSNVRKSKLQYLPFIILLVFSVNSWLFTLGGIMMWIADEGVDWSLLGMVYLTIFSFILSLILTFLTAVSYAAIKK